jgi:hypothetical protein
MLIMDRERIETMRDRAQSLADKHYDEGEYESMYEQGGRVSALDDILLMLRNEEREVSSDGTKE